jgi:subtilisin
MSPAPPDFLADLLAGLTPARLLADPRATGDGVRVAVIDSGVERAVLTDKYARLGTPIHAIEGAVFRPGSPAALPYDGRQSSPHGTIVADVILSIAPGVRLFSADVFGPAGNCEVETVIAALRHALDVWGVKVVNLSLGVPEGRLAQLPRRQQFQRAIEEAYFRDVLVFAAAHNDHPFTRSYPAGFAPPLLSVDKGPFDDPLGFAYLLRDGVEFQANGRGNLGPFAREPATSWATPHLAAVAAKLLSLKPDLKPFEVKTLLYWMSRAASG